ncbi:DUF4817 domain-containing protein [Trichonephila clavipes]|nr:DUF4817 domain-containing protein [Trichonephila clavipes]
MKEQLKQFCLQACVSVCVKRMLIVPFLADHRASRKMMASKQKAFCVFRLTETEPDITVQRVLRINFGCQPQNDNNILRWYHQFETTVNLCKGKSTERPRL